MINTKPIDSKVSTFIEEQAKGTSSYIQAWLDLLTRLYGYSAYPLVATNRAGKITGFLPLCSMQSPLTGRRLVALPFSDYCPLLAVDADSTNNLIDQAIDLAQKQRVRYLELRHSMFLSHIYLSKAALPPLHDAPEKDYREYILYTA